MDQEYSHIEEEALAVLKWRQAVDFPEMDKQMDMQKDEIINDLSFGRLALQIPEDHYELLTMAYPQLQNPDAQIKSLEWKRVMALDICLPYKVNAKQRKM